MSHYDVVGIGYPSLDHTIKLSDEPVLGQTSIIENVGALSPFYGGCAVNITYLLGTLNKKTALSMSVGRNFEESGFKDFLEKNDVSLEFVQVNHNFDTSYTFLVMSTDGEHMTLFYPGPMTPENYEPYDYSNLDAKYGLLTIGEINGNKQFLDSCIEKNIPLIFSMKGDYASLDEDYLLKVFKYSELIFMNSSEYDQLNQFLPQPVLDYLSNSNLKAIIVTNGSKGSTVYTSENIETIPAYVDVNVVDTAGGGDAYIAGFLNSYLDGKDFLECAITGTSVSSYIIEDYGCLTNIPTDEEIRYREKQLKGEIDK